MAEIKINHLFKSYGSTPVLKDISLSLRSGELVSLLGASGSGKTTLLRCLAGLEAPDAKSGTISIGGQTVSGPGVFLPPETRNLGMVFQSYAVWPHLNVYENVAYPLKLRLKKKQLTSKEVQLKTQEALERVQLLSLQNRFPHQLSGGQQQRVALARALAMSPQVLLLDEPLSNLDALLREELGTEIRKLQLTLGLTAVMVTHDQKEALALSDRVVVLHHGQIDAMGSPEELYSHPPTDYTAGFLSGGYFLTARDGSRKRVLPRKWRVLDQGDTPVEIRSRTFLGNEYEYLAQSEAFAESIRFFAPTRYESGERIRLSLD